MTDEELDRLADSIARSLIAAHQPAAGASRARQSWLPLPVRPEPPTRGGELPPWTAAAQRLGDVAPTHAREAPAHRATTAELTAATRAAAAGKGTRVAAGRAPSGITRAPGRRRGRAEPSIEVSIGVSNRHAHLSPEHVRTLFGGELTSERALSQPGQFAARERLDITGPGGSLRGVRVVGPVRGRTQLELSPSDCRAVGVAPPIRASGELEGSPGGVTLTGPAGSITLDGGVIIPARHLHLSAGDARAWGISDGDLLDVHCGSGARAMTLHDVIVRSGPRYATELHLDIDEAYAAGVRTGDHATVVSWRSAALRRRPLITEREVLAHAREGRALPPDALLTPSARDRARALDLLRE